MKFDFPNHEGQILSGRLEMPATEPRAFALFAHCFTCTKDVIAAATIAKTLTEHGIGVLRFDFTGLGNSQGDFSNTNFSSNVKDLVSACSELGQQFRAPEILIGHSLGGAAVLKAAGELESIKAVVTIGAPSSVGHVSHLFENDLEAISKDGEAQVQLAGRKFTIKQQFVDDINETDVLETVKNFHKALLVMHSPTDNYVSVDHAGKIFQAAKHPKSFVSLDNADHLLLKRADAQYAARTIASWVERYIPQAAAPSVNLSHGDVLVSHRRDKKFTQDIFSEKHHLVADEPRSVKGEDLGMSPYELLLASLGACTSMTMKMYADLKGIPLESASVHLHHEKIHAKDCESCETTSGKVDKIQKSIELFGDLTDKQRTKLLEIAEKCPVNRTLMSETFIEKVERT